MNGAAAGAPVMCPALIRKGRGRKKPGWAWCGKTIRSTADGERHGRRGRRADGRIDIKLGGPRSPWELNNKCTKLRSAVDRIATQHAGAPLAVAALTRLLSVSGTSIEWGYLNSGVHDSQRDHEYDRATVRTIVESITALDEALAALQNR